MHHIILAIKATLHTCVLRQFCNATALCSHGPEFPKSLELAQQASIVANSAAQGAGKTAFFGRTLSLSIFILSQILQTLKANVMRW